MRTDTLAWIALTALLLAACGDDEADDDDTAQADAAATPDAAGDPDAATNPADTIHSILAGSFAPLPAYAGMPLSGRAQLVRTVDGTTTAQLQVSGLTAATAHGAHVHALPCEFLAGGHYKIDPAEAATLESNEIWPAFTTDADGNASADVSVAHRARGDALAIVVHDPAGGAKMMCADLLPGDTGDVTAGGTFAPFAASEAVDADIAGTASLVRKANSTDVSVSFTGLDAAEAYVSHVHALPCGVTDAGGHYQRDPTVVDSDEANELWPTIGAHPDGTATDSFTAAGHVARADAQSVVVHRIATGGSPKVACADLTRDSWPGLDTAGNATLFDAATDRGFDELAASATMTRSLDGTTTATLSVTGLAASAQYPAHVHNLACDVQSGGGHYNLDPGVTDTQESNEIWLVFTTDESGSGQASAAVEHTARAEAQSIVIHDSTDGARLACIDLD
jgi:hypothetical protein